MKTLLVAINAKYEHENTAVWYLKSACSKKGLDVLVQQHTINDDIQHIYMAIMEEKPDVAAFSCYIWNRETVLKLIPDLKRTAKGIRIIIGGPEVIADAACEAFINAGADYIVKGPGEQRFAELISKLYRDEEPDTIRHYLKTGVEMIEDNRYVSPFMPEYLRRISNRIAYIESSRGCPYGCTYCLSSACRGMVFFPPEEVKADIAALVDAGARVIKFVDRSFNTNVAHSLTIWEYIRSYPREKVTFHFEINPDGLTEEQFSMLKTMPHGLVQLEAGIQSLNLCTLKAVERRMDPEKALLNLKRLMSMGNMHIHADLIAGLPYDTLETFKDAFNRVFRVEPHHLQLGFLKLLHGTKMRNQADNLNYAYRSYPPYEVLSSDSMSAEDLILLKGVEDVVERFFNTGRFSLSLKYASGFFETAFDFFNCISRQMKEKGLLHTPVSALGLYEFFEGFGRTQLPEHAQDIFKDLLCLDYACGMKTANLPDFLLSGSLKDGPVKLDLKQVMTDIGCNPAGRKDFFKRYVALEGLFPIKNGENLTYVRNKIMVDTRCVDPVTGRAAYCVIAKDFALG